MAKYHQSFYEPKNPEKYIGKNTPYFRSSWELKLMQFFDDRPDVIAWQSEGMRIPYRNPFTGKPTFYVPDFFVIYENKNKQRRAEVIEVKPTKHMTEHARSTYDRASAALNEAKWTTARQWCKQQGFHFRIITEYDIFRKPGKLK